MVLAFIYWHIDYTEFHKFQVFPWDSNTYHEMAQHFRDHGFSRIAEPNPLGPRMLFPLIYGLIAAISGTSLFVSGYLVNMFSLWLVCISTLYLWSKKEISWKYSIPTIMAFLLISAGPFRYTSNYIGQFGFECLVALSTLFAIFKLVTAGQKWLFLSPIIAFFAATGREFSVGVSIGVFLALCTLKIFQRVWNLGELFTYKVSRVLLVIIGGIAGYGFARWFIPNNHSFEWSIKATLIDTFYTNLSPVNVTYPFYAGLGTLTFVITANLLNKNLRNAYFKRLSTINHITLIYVFAFVAIIIALIAGPDRDRYLIWYFPLFGFFAIIGAQNIAQTTKLGGKFFVLLIVITLAWTRFYVPALPHTVFNKDFPTQIKTDYNPKSYSGLPLLRRFRLPLKEFVVMPDSATPMDQAPKNEIAFFASSQTLDKKGLEHVPTVYKHHANYIPIPLGIPTNQYEMLQTTPTWGNFRVRAAILAQWLILQFGLALFLRKKMKKINQIQSA